MMRDPRVDPKAGDVLRRIADGVPTLRYVLDVPEHGGMILVEDVLMGFGKSRKLRPYPYQFRLWARTATVEVQSE